MKSVFIRVTFIYLLLALVIPLSSQAATERRTALVIGNSSYSSGPLKNPVNDASDMATALRNAGFTVVLKKDANLETMEEVIEDFGNRLKRGGVGLFYYAGHGVQVNGVNYLIPIGAKVNKESDVRFKAFDVGRILAEMENANNGLNIVLLDACRDNPFGKSFRSAARGLAIVSNAPTGTLISYSTSPGQVAIDGEGSNSPYTRALLKYMQEPGTPITELFIKVRQKLRKETGQVPWELSSIEGKFYFVPGKAGKSMEAVKEEAAAPTAELDDEQRKIDGEREKLRKEKELLEQKEALAREKRELAEREKQLAIGARPSASTNELDDKIRKLEMVERELEEQRPRMDPERLDSMQKKLRMERNRLEEEKKQLAIVTSPSLSSANEIGRDGRFIAYENGTVLDTQANLMWASMDNGFDIKWSDAKSYCEKYHGAGYKDWRMPTQAELASLYDTAIINTTTPTGGCFGGYHLTNLIHLTCCCAWASDSDGIFFNFTSGIRRWAHGSDRVLPVRSAK